MLLAKDSLVGSPPRTILHVSRSLCETFSLTAMQIAHKTVAHNARSMRFHFIQHPNRILPGISRHLEAI